MRRAMLEREALLVGPRCKYSLNGKGNYNLQRGEFTKMNPYSNRLDSAVYCCPRGNDHKKAKEEDRLNDTRVPLIAELD